MSDLIDRQAAIDICANAIDLWRGQLGEGALIAVRDKIKELLSAEPEIIRCRECKYYNRALQLCNNGLAARAYEFFCADGKKMDGGAEG